MATMYRIKQVIKNIRCIMFIIVFHGSIGVVGERKPKRSCNIANAIVDLFGTVVVGDLQPEKTEGRC